MRHPARRVATGCVWVLGIPAFALLLLYLVLLITPIRLPFVSNAVVSMARSALPPTSNLLLGDMALALEKGVWPVLRFSPVLLTDAQSGSRIAIDALEVGFSPIRALIGQPGATVTVVGPHMQIVQDLFGPRPTSFQISPDPDGGRDIVRVQEGAEAFPPVAISASGIDMRSTTDRVPMLSDNEMLIHNIESGEKSIADIVDNAANGLFSRLVIRDGTVDLNDAVYGLFRRFDNIDLTVSPTGDRRNTTGTFSARLAGRTMLGNLTRTVDDAGAARLEADVTNIDFAAFMPFINDPTSPAAVTGTGALSIDVGFAPDTGKLVGGQFKVDLTGLDLRIGDTLFPIATSIMDIDWSPQKAQFTLNDAAIQIGQSSATLSGVFGMGVDRRFGPTVGMALKATNLSIHPNDMDAPAEPFDSLEFSGWSAPLYGALGVDRILARKGDATIEATGRVDMLQAGMGLSMTVAGQGVSADDLKRLWPYMLGTPSRDWFVANVSAGTVTSGRLAFNYPVGTMSLKADSEAPIPDGALQIDMVGTGIEVKPTAEMAPIQIAGDTRLQIDDANVTISADGGELQTARGPITVTNPALVMDNSIPNENIVEVSGDITGAIPALLDLVNTQQPELLNGLTLPVDLESITGSVDVGLVTTITLPDRAETRELQVGYVLNGTVSDFASSQPIKDRTIGNGQLAFSASQAGYQLGGTAEIDGIPAEVEISGTPETEPRFRLSSTLNADQLAEMGFDVSQFLTGQLRFVAQPLDDGSIQLGMDLVDAGLTVRDLGVTKAAGTPGTMQVNIRQSGEITDLTGIDLAFDAVRLSGGIKYHTTEGLKSANFSRFALSEGDNAQVALQPVDGGYAVQVRGEQLDLKPVLQRYFGLDQGTGGVQTSEVNQSLSLDVKLDRAVGYFATTAFNIDLALSLRGADLRRVKLTGQFGDGNGLSIATNPTPDGRTMSVAFNDAGTILRFLGIYSQLAGGEGSLVLNTNTEQKVDAGRLLMRGFAIVDEANVAQVLGNHSDSRAAISRQNRLDFDNARVDFIRRTDRVEIANAMVTGSTIGGTARGFIYTDQRQYDITGTYVPLFGLNSAFQKIPVLGSLLGGRDGEGLVGVTFAVKGPLASPEFLINPLSALLPGALRELFEFRAEEQPRAQ